MEQKEKNPTASKAENIKSSEKLQEELVQETDELTEETTDETISQEESLTKALESLQEELKAKDEQILRQRAEFDNYRKRTQREKEELYQSATADCVLAFLNVLDNLERAAESDGEACELKEGVEMILKQFREQLSRMNVKEIDALGNEFDPNRHNAVNRIEDEKYGENVVCQVFQKGYEQNGKVLRHAMVVVANP